MGVEPGVELGSEVGRIPVVVGRTPGEGGIPELEDIVLEVAVPGVGGTPAQTPGEGAA